MFIHPKWGNLLGLKSWVCLKANPRKRGRFGWWTPNFAGQLSISPAETSIFHQTIVGCSNCWGFLRCHGFFSTTTPIFPRFSNQNSSPWSAGLWLPRDKERLERDMAMICLDLPCRYRGFRNMGCPKMDGFYDPPWNFLERIRQPGLSVSAWFFRKVPIL